MSLADCIEEILRERGRARLVRASEQGGHRDGYAVRELPDGGATVRYGPGVMIPCGAARGRYLNPGLEVCSEILARAGLRVELLEDDQGGYLAVAAWPR